MHVENPRERIDRIIRDYSESLLYRNMDFFFVQIGSNDGKTGDPLYEYIKECKWKGILVEPVPYLFEKLKQTYRGFEGLLFENSAIDTKDGYRTFYRIE